MTDHECKQENLLREMHGDIKSLVAEFRAMNGSLRETRTDFSEHRKASVGYRDKINVIWAMVHTVKWAIGLLFGAGILFKVYEVFVK